MKELTIEEKAQRYDEALEKAKSALDCLADDYICNHLTKDDIRGIYAKLFFELKMSEDKSKEDERKISLLDALCDDQISKSSFSSTMYREMGELKDWLKSLKDRVQPLPKQEWKQENTGDLTDFENTMMHIGESFFGQYAGLDPNDTKAIKEQANLLLELVPKKEWSEEDEMFVHGLIRGLAAKRDIHGHTTFSSDCIDITETIDWLKSLKDRVQPKQEWSQNDIDMIDWLIRCCEKEHEELCNDKYGHQDIVSDLKRDCRKKWDWLESLKNRVAPQKQWKPSEEQMKALDDVISSRDIKYDALSELWKDLKQL